MRPLAWRTDDAGPLEQETPAPRQLLVSFHFLRSALRRRWRVWVTLAVVGFAAALAIPFVLPQSSTATTTVVLSHASGSDPAEAMSTDVSMAGTRAVAALVIRQLHLPMTPSEFQDGVTITSVTTSIMKLSVGAPTDQQALTRARALTNAFLQFRSKQLRAQAESQIAGYQRRVSTLNKQIAALNQQYDSLNTNGAATSQRAQDLLDERAQLSQQVNTLQQQVESITLQTESVIGASRRIDSAALVPRSHLRRIVLDAGSGLIAGLALGVGLVCFRELTSDRLRRREEVALALGVPVRLSVPPLRGPRLAVLARGRRAPSRHALQILVRGLGEEMLEPTPRPTRLILAAIDSAEESVTVAAHTGARLAAERRRVLLVDLTEHGTLEAAIKRACTDGVPENLAHFRPESVPMYAHGPLSSSKRLDAELPKGDPARAVWDRADVVLIVAELSPAIGVSHLTSWADRVVFLVAAGRTSGERMRTLGELTAASGLDVRPALMVGADATDESLGLEAEPEAPLPAIARAEL
jgi:capsular polysaccharide biosynthesis protein